MRGPPNIFYLVSIGGIIQNTKSEFNDACTFNIAIANYGSAHRDGNGIMKFILLDSNRARP